MEACPSMKEARKTKQLTRDKRSWMFYSKSRKETAENTKNITSTGI